MKLVGSGFVGKVGNSAAGVPVFGGVVRALYLELCNRIRARLELGQAATTQVKAADGNAVNQNLVAEQLPAVDGTRPWTVGGVATTGDGSRKAAENDRLKVAAAITYLDGKGFEFLRGHGGTYLGRCSLQQWSLRRDDHGFLDTPRLQLEIHRDHLRDRHHDLIGDGSLKAGPLGLHLVAARRHWHAVVTSAAGLSCPFHAGIKIGDSNCGLGYNRAACVL